MSVTYDFHTIFSCSVLKYYHALRADNFVLMEFTKSFV